MITRSKPCFLRRASALFALGALSAAFLGDAIADTPITFVGNTGSVEKQLGDFFFIEGTAMTAGNYSGLNLRTEVDGNGNLQLQMADNPVFESVITGNTMINNDGLTILGGPSVSTYGIDAGYQKITSVAAGDISDNSTDAINGSQLSATNQQVSQNTTNINNMNTSISNGTVGTVQRTGTDQLSLIAAGGDASAPGNAQVLTNVAQGALNANSIDAINGSQLHETNQQVEANTTNISNIDGRVTTVEGNVTTLQGDVTNLANTPITFLGNAGAVEKRLGETFIIQGAESTAGSYSGSNLRTEVDGNGNLQLQMADNPVFESVITGNTTINNDGLTILGGPSVTTYGIDAGNQKITSVAAGDISDSSTDAINGSQLSATNQQVSQNTTNINNMTTNISNGTLGPVQRTGTDLLSLIAAGGDASAPGNAQMLTNVAAGAVNANSIDAINGSQLYATNQQVDVNTTNITNLDGRVTTVTGDVTTLQGNVTNLGNHIDNIYNTGTKYFHANSTGSDSSATGVDSVAIGMGAVSSHDGSVALGAGSVANGSTLGHQAYLVGGTATGEVNIGNRRVTGLSAGADDTDAVNVAQLKKVTAASTEGSVKYDLNGDGTVNYNNVTLGGTTYNSVTKVGGTRITNVARGVSDSDAVNMSQLNETNAQVTNIDGRVTTVEGSITNINNGAGIKYFHANSSKADSVASGTDSVAVGPSAQASGKGSVAMGDGASAAADGSVALGQGASDNGRGAENYTGKYSGAANASVGTVSVGNAAKGETRTLSNVADGKEATDAVNLRQLDGAVTESKHYTDNSISKVNTEVTNVTKNVTNLDNRVTHVEGNVTKVQNGTDGMFQVNNTRQLAKPKPVGKDSVAGGAGAVAAGDNSTAIGSNAKASARNSVAVGANSVAERDNSVSVGSAGSERQITNVAAGTVKTDAVNLGQLQKSIGDISNQFYDYTDSRYNALRHDLKKQDDILSSGIAGAMAMATLPQPHTPGASMTSVGLGNFRGQGALAVGVSKITDNGKWVIKLQGSATSQGESGVAAGVGYQW
ncbi:YadA family autotransporter adhesin [Pseudomonas sp. H9]|uniref:YadA family autotransporter adhesin n=1 Tax=Pseudomonas sp. H9 TaxID=483968 RepID=UPI001404CA4B|nr:YadA family autotransporter adhesin [Pseudomonas sp. H9]